MALEMRDQLRPKRLSFVARSYRIELERHPRKPKPLPQSTDHDELLDVDVGTGESQRFRAEGMVLAIAAFLRPLVAEQRSAVPEPFRSVVEQVVLQRGADRRRRALRAQRKHFAVVVERVHLLLDYVGDFADTAHEELGLFHDRRADVSITVLPKH